MTVRVLVVDDSAVVRRILTEALDEDDRIEVVGAAMDAYQARDMIVQLAPDVLTLDVEMPRMTGLEFLQRLMVHVPMPVVMVSSLTQQSAPTAVAALEAGAVDVVGKPRSSHGLGLEEMVVELREKVVAASRARVVARRPGHARTTQRMGPVLRDDQQRAEHVIALGASTGGPDALVQVLAQFSAQTPPVVVVQHMPAAFTAAFAQRMDRICALRVTEATDGDVLRPGHAYLAPGGQQMRVIRHDGRAVVRVAEGPPVSGHAPSVDVLLRSVAAAYGPRAAGAVLTGMGVDGAAGLLAMREAGAVTVAQDEASCVVYGMPRACVENGATSVLASPTDIPVRLAQLLSARMSPA